MRLDTSGVFKYTERKMSANFWKQWLAIFPFKKNTREAWNMIWMAVAVLDLKRNFSLSQFHCLPFQKLKTLKCCETADLGGLKCRWENDTFIYSVVFPVFQNSDASTEIELEVNKFFLDKRQKFALEPLADFWFVLQHLSLSRGVLFKFSSNILGKCADCRQNIHKTMKIFARNVKSNIVNIGILYIHTINKRIVSVTNFYKLNIFLTGWQWHFISLEYWIWIIATERLRECKLEHSAKRICENLHNLVFLVLGNRILSFILFPKRWFTILH